MRRWSRLNGSRPKTGALQLGMLRKTVQKSGMILALLGVISLIGISINKRINSSTNPSHSQPIRPRPSLSPDTSRVAALGTLQPSGDVHLLAGPVLQQGGAPRVQKILVDEGDRVRRDQLVARFDNYERSVAERDRIVANIESKKSEIAILESETKRYRILESQGAYASGDLESRELKLLDLKNQLRELRVFLREVETKVVDSELRSPIDGYVLKINAREGERPGDQGVMEIGDSDNMDAVLQVDEADIKSVKVGMPVRITSENGAFASDLQATVTRIGVRVRSRQVISNNPSSDTDQEDRVIEVRATLSPDSTRKVRDLVGVKVLGHF